MATTQLNDRDVDRLARFLGMKVAEFCRDYTVLTEDEGRILRRLAESALPGTEDR